VLHDHKVPANQPLPDTTVERVTHYAEELVKRLDIA
jgi:hypothetical protein